jgi:hypothetical protein
MGGAGLHETPQDRKSSCKGSSMPRDESEYGIKKEEQMKKVMSLVYVVLVFSGAAIAGAAIAKETQLEKATNVHNEIMGTPDKGIPHDLLDRAVCVGIVPSEIKAAFIVGGTYGRGVLVCRRHGDSP